MARFHNPEMRDRPISPDAGLPARGPRGKSAPRLPAAIDGIERWRDPAIAPSASHPGQDGHRKNRRCQRLRWFRFRPNRNTQQPGGQRRPFGTAARQIASLHSKRPPHKGEHPSILPGSEISRDIDPGDIRSGPPRAKGRASPGTWPSPLITEQDASGTAASRPWLGRSPMPCVERVGIDRVLVGRPRLPRGRFGEGSRTRHLSHEGDDPDSRIDRQRGRCGIVFRAVWRSEREALRLGVDRAHRGASEIRARTCPGPRQALKMRRDGSGR